MSKIRTNVATKVNAGNVRAEKRDGRSVLIVASKTLPDNIIMNGVLYPADEIKKAFNTLEGTQAPFGHPQVDGQFVNALHPAALNSAHIGAHNENVRQEDGVVLLDKVIDVDVASRTEQGRAVLDAINKGDPIHTSTGLYYEPEDAPKGKSYHTIARNMVFDHDCILIGESGAATPAQGVGMMVNSVLEDSTVTRRAELTAALRALKPLGDGWYWLRDDDDAVVVFEFEPQGTSGSTEYATDYTIAEDGVLTLSSDIYPVKQVTVWERVKAVVAKLTVITNKEAVTMTPEELKAQLDAHMSGVKQLLDDSNKAVAEQLTATNAAIAELGAEQRAKVDATTAANRATVAAKYGELVANALEGDALADMAAKCQIGAGVAAPVIGTNADLSNTLPE